MYLKQENYKLRGYTNEFISIYMSFHYQEEETKNGNIPTHN